MTLSLTTWDRGLWILVHVSGRPAERMLARTWSKAHLYSKARCRAGCTGPNITSCWETDMWTIRMTSTMRMRRSRSWKPFSDRMNPRYLMRMTWCSGSTSFWRRNRKTAWRSSILISSPAGSRSTISRSENCFQAASLTPSSNIPILL